MHTGQIKSIALVICLVGVMFSVGCTNWEKKYKALDVEHQNTVGLLAHERAQKGELVNQVTQSQQTIEELQRQIAEQQKSPQEVTGFEGQVDVDAKAGTITVTLPNEILFSSGKATMKKATSAELDHIRSVLQERYSGKLVDVVGHTDNDPIKKSEWKDNWELSSQRSLTVVRYLTQQGIPDEHVRAVGRGASQPIAANTTSSGKARNRRVEIVVHMR